VEETDRGLPWDAVPILAYGTQDNEMIKDSRSTGQELRQDLTNTKQEWHVSNASHSSVRKYVCFKCDFTNNPDVDVNLLYTTPVGRHISSRQSNFDLNYLCNTSVQDISLTESAFTFTSFRACPLVVMPYQHSYDVIFKTSTIVTHVAIITAFQMPTCNQLAIWTVLYSYFVSTVYVCDLHHYVVSTFQVFN
jgi:predicted RNA-binding Zn-ribbon protein involved in translation (DUF1610 family)